MSIKIGTKVKKFEYDPNNIMLQVYQFEKRIMFSNAIPNPRTKGENKSFETDEKVQKNVERQLKKTAPKKRKPKKPTKPKQESSTERYKPKFGIIWEN